MSPTVSVNGTVKVGNESQTSTSITGVSEEYLDLKEQALDEGRFIQYSDIVSRQKVCVVGYYIAQELYGGSSKALGETIKVNGEAYEIVGCVERQTSESDDVEEGGSDDFLYLPYTTAVKLSRNGVIGNYVFTTVDTDETETVKDLFDEFLYPIFKDEDLYSITAMSEMLDSLNSMIAMMSLLVGGIAGISSSGGRRGRNEHYAGVRDGAHPGDRHPQIPGREAQNHHAAVRHRGGRHQLPRRNPGNCPGLSSDRRHRQYDGNGGGADAGVRAGGLRRVGGDRASVRLYARGTGCTAESD